MLPSRPPAGPCSLGMLSVSLWAEQQVGALARVAFSSAALEGACCFQALAAKRDRILGQVLKQNKKINRCGDFF